MGDEDEVEWEVVIDFDESAEWTDEEIQEFFDSIGDLEGCHEE